MSRNDEVVPRRLIRPPDSGNEERFEGGERHGTSLLSILNLCVVGNHDLDDESGPDAFAQVHGPMNFDFSCGHTRFVVLHAAPGVPGEIMDRFAETDEGTQGPRGEDLAFSTTL